MQLTWRHLTSSSQEKLLEIAVKLEGSEFALNYCCMLSSG
jgi:hypothetical protein